MPAKQQEDNILPNSQAVLLADDLPPLEHDAAVLPLPERHPPEQQGAGHVKHDGVHLGQRAAELQVLRPLLLLQFVRRGGEVRAVRNCFVF